MKRRSVIKLGVAALLMLKAVSARAKGPKILKDPKTGWLYYEELWFVSTPDGFVPVKKKHLVRQSISFEDEVITVGVGVDDPKAPTTPLSIPPVKNQGERDAARDRAAKSDPDLAVDHDAPLSSYQFGSAGGQAATQAFAYGVLAATAGLPNQAARIETLQQEIASLEAAIAVEAQVRTQAGAAVQEALAKRSAALDAALSAVAELPRIGAADALMAAADGKTLFATPDPFLAMRLQRLGNSIQSAPSYRLPSTLKDVGMAAIRQGDIESAMGNNEEAESFAGLARTIADFTIGIDPVTAPVRGLYELATGTNFITGKPLSALEHGFAVINVMFLGGFGTVQKAVQGLGKLGRVLGGNRGKAVIKTVTEIFTKWPTNTLDRLLRWRASKTAVVAEEVIELMPGKSNVPLGALDGRHARIMDKRYADQLTSGGTLAGDKLAFITDAGYIQDITSRTKMAERLGLYEKMGYPTVRKLKQLDDYVVVEFRLRQNAPLDYLASPFGEAGRFGPAFLPGGWTSGGAPEWVIDSSAIARGLIDPSSINIRYLPNP